MLGPFREPQPTHDPHLLLRAVRLQRRQRYRALTPYDVVRLVLRVEEPDVRDRRDRVRTSREVVAPVWVARSDGNDVENRAAAARTRDRHRQYTVAALGGSTTRGESDRASVGAPETRDLELL